MTNFVVHQSSSLPNIQTVPSGQEMRVRRGEFKKLQSLKQKLKNAIMIPQQNKNSNDQESKDLYASISTRTCFS